MKGLILGIDGGGSKTVAVLTDLAGQEIGRGSGGASNFQAVGFDRAQEALMEAVHRCFEEATLPLQMVSYMVLGMAGAGQQVDQERMRDWCLKEKLAEKADVITDAELLLWAGTPDGWGLGCISGTGSIAFGADRKGKIARSGGWGYILGDEGSGYAIGLAALRAVVQAADGRSAPTALSGKVLKEWHLQEANDLVRRVYQQGAAREAIAALSQVVAAEAQAGDAVSRAILQNAALELSMAIVAVAGQLDLHGSIPCALGGGVLTHNKDLTDQVIWHTRRAGIRIEPVEIVHEPVLGAVKRGVKAMALGEGRGQQRA